MQMQREIPKGAAVLVFDALRTNPDYRARMIQWLENDEDATEAEATFTALENAAKSCADANEFHRLINQPEHLQAHGGKVQAALRAAAAAPTRSTFGWHAPSY